MKRLVRTSALVLLFALLGCKGDSGEPGTTGPRGDTGATGPTGNAGSRDRTPCAQPDGGVLPRMVNIGLTHGRVDTVDHNG